MLRLVETELASSGKLDSGYRTPSCFLHLRAMDALAPERHDLDLQVDTHQKELVPVVRLGGMNRQLRRRKGENQSSVTSDH